MSQKKDRKPEAERFWAKVTKTETCWLWTGAFLETGYGVFRTRNDEDTKWLTTRVHRFSYEQSNGTIPQGMKVDHICHVISCVNPAHLRAVTQKQNMENRQGAQVGNISGVRGVSKSRNKWAATIGQNGRSFTLGRYDSIDEAAHVAREARLKLFTHNDVDRAA